MRGRFLYILIARDDLAAFGAALASGTDYIDLLEVHVLEQRRQIFPMKRLVGGKGITSVPYVIFCKAALL
jgi:hypothetical protein